MQELMVNPNQWRVIVVHANRRGVDKLVSSIATENEWSQEVHPIRWSGHDKGCPEWHTEGTVCASAGYRANEKMIKCRADVCIAFNPDQNPVSRDLVARARAVGIPVTVFDTSTRSRKER
jgi:hypothetical protein